MLILTQTCPGEPKVCFSPGNSCFEHVVKVIDEAKENLDVAVYYLTDSRICQAIGRARERKIKTRLLTDDEAIRTKYVLRCIRDLDMMGVKIRVDADKGIMHHKFVIADQKTLLTGSFNFTNAATNINDENMMVWECPNLAKTFQTEFDKMWESRSQSWRDAVPK